jgi:cell division protein FtsQ
MAKRRKSGRQSGAEIPAGVWDRPALLNMVADLLLFLAALALGYAAVVAALRLPLFPLRQVVVTHPLGNVTVAQLEYAARTALHGNFFTLNLDQARGAFEKLPWVRRADLRRRWPDVLELTLEEHVAAALWQMNDGEMRVVNDRGEVFAAATNARLPVFAGPEGSAPEILQRHAELVALLAPIGRTPERVLLSARQAWQLRLDDGLIVELGRDQPKTPLAERIARFVAVYPAALELAKADAASVDLRYPNGFALRPGRARTEIRGKT